MRANEFISEDYEFDAHTSPEHIEDLSGRPKGVAPHEGGELGLMKRGLKPAAIILPKIPAMQIIKANKWPYKIEDGGLFVGTTKENLERLLQAYKMTFQDNIGWGPRDVALGRALGYSEENIKDWLEHSGRVSEGKESYQPPTIDVGDEVRVGKFKNRKAEVKGFKTDKNNQPVLKTTKGDQQLFKPRITKLMKDQK